MAAISKQVQKFAHFCEKTRMNIEGLSATTLEKFIGHGWIRNFGDLYTLDRYKEEIINTEGFGMKSYERLQASIDKSRSCTLAKFIAGLGIPMVGRHAGRELDKCFGSSWEAFEQAIKDGFDFTSLSDFGATMPCLSTRPAKSCTSAVFLPKTGRTPFRMKAEPLQMDLAWN